MTKMYVFSRTPELALVYAEDYLKRFFTKEDEIEFEPRDYYSATWNEIEFEHGCYLAVDGRGANKPVLDCVANLRRASVIHGLFLEVIFMDLYRVVDPIELAKVRRSFEKDVTECDGLIKDILRSGKTRE